MPYNLWDESWIPVVRGDQVDEVSLRTVLVEAHAIRALATSPATMTVVLVRLLVAVLMDALGPLVVAAHWRDRFVAGQFDAKLIGQYRDEHHARFDLLDDSAPFMQVPGLEPLGGKAPKPVAGLVAHLPAGNNVPLFNAITEAERPLLTLGAGARWLLHALGWDTAAIKTGVVGDPQAKAGKTTGNPTGPLGRFGAVVPEGQNLFETLMLNTLIEGEGRSPDDVPVWRRPPLTPAWTARAATGAVDLLTFPSRRIRLVVSNEMGSPKVSAAVIAAGDRLIEVPSFEPHTMWNVNQKPKPGESPLRPRRLQSGKAAWRGLDALVATTQRSAEGPVRTTKLLNQVTDLKGEGVIPADFPLGVLLAGVEYGNQNAVFENLLSDAMPLPVVALRSDEDTAWAVDQMATDADVLAKLITRLERGIREATGGEGIPWDKGQRASSRLMQLLDDPVRRILAGLQRHPDQSDEAELLWAAVAQRLAWQVADELIRAAPPNAFASRRQRQEDDKKAPVAEAERYFKLGLRKLFPDHRIEMEEHDHA